MTPDFIRSRMRAAPRWSQGILDLLSDVEGEDLVMAEIGCYAGESFRIFAGSGRIKTFHAVDPWVLQYNLPIEIERDECGFIEAELAFDESVPLFPGVSVVKHRMRSSAAAKLIPDHSLDLLYVDGGHDYLSVRTDLVLMTPKVRPGGVVAGHDYRSGWPDVTRAVDEFYGSPDKVYSDTSWMRRISK